MKSLRWSLFGLLLAMLAGPGCVQKPADQSPPLEEGAKLLAEGQPQLSVVLPELLIVTVVQMPEGIELTRGRAPEGTLVLVDQVNGVWIGSWQSTRGPLPKGKSYRIVGRRP